MRRLTVRLFLAGALAVGLLHVYGKQKVDAENLALGAENLRTQEIWKGQAFTGGSISEISRITVEFEHVRSAPNSATNVSLLLWLGNSQLHTINQFKSGDHLSPYELRTRLSNPDHTIPLGFSLPNVNFQEYLALNAYVLDQLPIRCVIMALVFDDLREDGLRSDFSQIESAQVRSTLVSYSVGKEMLALADANWGDRRAGQENPGLEGFAQKEMEDVLSARLAEAWPLWADRPNLRARLMDDIYRLRNWVLGIKPTSVRKIIRPRYARNMAALTAVLAELRKRGIPVLLYIAPIRQDHPLPYDLKEYSAWKTGVTSLAEEYSARLLNLETLVPPQYWGTYHDDDIDFMHFQGKGHQLLAQALVPHVEAMLGRSR